MCDQVEKRILFQQAAYQREENMPMVDASHRGVLDLGTGNSVYVELRQFEFDVILESIVLVDGQEVINSRKCIDRSSAYEHIRMAIQQFDTLVHNHPVTVSVATLKPEG
jgi:hypothetical protein